MYCYKCGQLIDDEAVVCPHCGCATKNFECYGNRQSESAANISERNVSSKSRLVALLLCIFLGGIGVHRYYIGKIGTGVLWTFTAGCFYIGWIIDIILISCGKMKDKDGRLILDWDGANTVQRATATASETIISEQSAVATEPWENEKEQQKNPWYGMLRVVLGLVYSLFGVAELLCANPIGLSIVMVGIAVIVWGVVDRKKKQKK